VIQVYVEPVLSAGVQDIVHGLGVCFLCVSCAVNMISYLLIPPLLAFWVFVRAAPAVAEAADGQRLFRLPLGG